MRLIDIGGLLQLVGLYIQVSVRVKAGVIEAELALVQCDVDNQALLRFCGHGINSHTTVISLLFKGSDVYIGGLKLRQRVAPPDVISNANPHAHRRRDRRVSLDKPETTLERLDAE